MLTCNTCLCSIWYVPEHISCFWVSGASGILSALHPSGHSCEATSVLEIASAPALAVTVLGGKSKAGLPASRGERDSRSKGSGAPFFKAGMILRAVVLTCNEM